MTGAIQAAQCSEQEKRDALERALLSRTFARSDQLRAFLRFVCEAEIRGAGAELTEHTIGVEVLHRPENYFPSEDSSVRTRAYELRHKLTKLYAEELTTDAVQIVIPRGSYAPIYVRSTPAAEPAPAPPLPSRNAVVPVVQDVSAASAPPSRSPRLIYGGLLMVGVVAGIGLTLAAMGLRSQAAVDPTIAEAWRLMAKPDANVLFCAATPLHLVVGPGTHEAYGSPTYPAPPEAYPLFRQHRPLAGEEKLGMIFTDNVLGVGTMNAVVAAANTLRKLGNSFQILPERAATLASLRGRNAMLFGAPVDSEAISKTLQDTPLTVDYEPTVKEFVIRDRLAGRIIVPQKEANGDFADVYGLLTVDSTRDSERGKLQTVVFSGITSAGTHGASEYFASARSMERLRAIFAKEGIRGFPPAYQVVVKCKFSNMLLVSYEYYFHRVLQRE
jgi:hypothetical protein